MKVNGNELGLDQLGLIDLENVHRNLSVPELVDDIIVNGEGLIGMRANYNSRRIKIIEKSLTLS